jgi:hypothetical protein
MVFLPTIPQLLYTNDELLYSKTNGSVILKINNEVIVITL